MMPVVCRIELVHVLISLVGAYETDSVGMSDNVSDP